MPQNKTGLELAIKIADKLKTEIDERYKSAKQRVSTYVMILAVLVTILSLFLQSQINSDSKLITFFNNITRAYTVQVIFASIFTLLFLLALFSTIYTVIFIMKVLGTLRLQTADIDSVKEASEGKTVVALKTYLQDIQSAIKYNEEAVNNRMSDIIRVNRWVVWLVILYFVLPIAYFLFVLSLK